MLLASCWTHRLLVCFGFLFLRGLPYLLARIVASNSLVTVMQGRWDDSRPAQTKFQRPPVRCCQACRHGIHHLDLRRVWRSEGGYRIGCVRDPCSRSLTWPYIARCTVHFSNCLGTFARIINTLIVTVLSDAEADIGMTVDLRKRKFQHPPVLDAVRRTVM